MSTALAFTPYAWAKLLHLRDAGKTEVGGFGITPPDDLLLVEDIAVPKQECSVASVDFDDDSVAEMMERLLDQGYEPCQTMRIWIHTHPGDSAQPSGTDWETFRKVFGRFDWRAMFILANGGNTYCRIRCERPITIEADARTIIDWGHPFPQSNAEAWEEEYKANIEVKKLVVHGKTKSNWPQVCPSKPHYGHGYVPASHRLANANGDLDDAALIKLTEARKVQKAKRRKNKNGGKHGGDGSSASAGRSVIATYASEGGPNDVIFEYTESNLLIAIDRSGQEWIRSPQGIWYLDKMDQANEPIEIDTTS